MYADSIHRFFTPTRITVASFFTLILIVTFLLSLPVSNVAGKSLSIIDAFFIATSAVCVTGLSPIDISKDLTFFGQLIILFSMQIGGLGLMTFATVFYAFWGKRLPIINHLVIQESFHHSPTSQIKILLRYVVIFTFVVEAIGTFVLFFYWLIREQFSTVGETLWNAVFHSVSAFTNGGFSLFSNSLVGFQKDYFVLFVMSALILLGGLGFLVNFEIKDYLRWRYFKKDKKDRFNLSIQTRLTLIVSIVIIFFGTIAIFLYEKNGAFANLNIGEGLLNSFFFTVTTRTAGFNSIDMLQFNGSSILLLMLFMFIGAGAGSTGGGIKIGTIGLLIAYFISRVRGKKRLNLWNRTIPQSSIDKASAILAAFAILFFITTLILMFTETNSMPTIKSQNQLLPMVFESISALCTVGISLETTSQLSELGKIVVTLAMFIGRVSPLGLALAISLRNSKAQFAHAEENIMVG